MLISVLLHLLAERFSLFYGSSLRWQTLIQDLHLFSPCSVALKTYST